MNTTNTVAVEPNFLDVAGRRLFTLRFRPRTESTGAFLYIPPFAEEMNRCRALAADLARALAARGLDCLLVDPSGTGDSSGTLAEANWDLWREDLGAAAAWLETQSAHSVTLLGLRLGALQAAELASLAPGRFPRLVLWQPVSDGKSMITQYLRLRIASTVLRGAEAETTKQIRQRLAAGELIEIAGYDLSGGLAASIESRRLADLNGLAGSRIDWVEVVSGGGEIPVAGLRVIARLQAKGCTVEGHAVDAPLVWQTWDREPAPGLIGKTVSILCGEH